MIKEKQKKFGTKIITEKEIHKTTIERKTNEVDIILEFCGDDNTNKGCTLKIIGKGDLTHHLIEDTAILLNQMVRKYVGHEVS